MKILSLSQLVAHSTENLAILFPLEINDARAEPDVPNPVLMLFEP